MASNLAKRLDRLEKLANELLTQQEGPVYVREADFTLVLRVDNFFGVALVRMSASSGG